MSEYITSTSFHPSSQLGGGFGMLPHTTTPASYALGSEFQAEDWTGTGNMDLPQDSLIPCIAAQIVPLDIHSFFIPATELSIADLLSTHPVPPLATSPVAEATVWCYYSMEPPNIMTDAKPLPGHVLAQYCPGLIRAVAVHASLHKSFNVSWLAGHQSICSSDDSSIYYPLWVVTLLADLAMLEKCCHRWSSSMAWLEFQVLDPSSPIFLPDLVDQCQNRLGHIPWKSSIANLGPVLSLTMLLSDDWLDDTMINAGGNYIMRKLGANESYVQIVDCFFILYLQRCKQTGVPYSSRTPLDNLVKTGKTTLLFFPLHVFGNHWTLFQVDLVDCTWSYADCLHHSSSPPPELLHSVIWWLESLVPSSGYKPAAFELPLPKQTDSFSCGVIVLNLMASILLRHEIWTPQTAATSRMEWFLLLSDSYHSSQVEENLIEVFVPTPPSNSLNTQKRKRSLSITKSDESDGYNSDSNEARKIRQRQPGVRPGSSWAHHTPPSNSSNTQKRKRSLSITKSDESDGYNSDSNEARKIRQRQPGVRPGSSWAHQKLLREHIKDTNYQPVDQKLQIFRNKILKDDPHARFDSKNLLKVRCSGCAEWIMMRMPFDVQRWKLHRGRAKCLKQRSTGFITTTVTSFFSSVTNPTPCKKVVDTSPMPCPGLSRTSDPQVDQYMSRTSAMGGGAPSRSSIACELFHRSEPLLWNDLTEKEKNIVLCREEALQKWKVSQLVGTIHSAKCKSIVRTPIDESPAPCMECLALYKLHSFVVALGRPMPLEQNMKYVPVTHRCADLGELYLKYKGVRQLLEQDDGRSPWLKFAQGVVAGEYQSETLLGMVEALVVKSKRVQAGKSLRNMKYPEAFSNFCNTLASTSTRAYLTFKRHFGGRGMNSIRHIRAKMPRFHPGLSAHNVALASAVLKKYDYVGPLALSWDDTELEPAIAIYQESKNVCIIIGSTDGTLRVESHDEIDQVFENARLNQAEKLRIWLLTIPLPKIPPILIAAVARASTEDADALCEMHFTLSDLLHAENIHPVSLSADGTEVERSTQRLITAAIPSHQIYVIPNDQVAGGKGNLVLRIPLYRGLYPIVHVQDSKHALKTARNQMFTGARILVLGYHCTYFSQLRELAANPAGPLFMRDVEKVDRQDDRAAARMFSSAALDFQMSNYPDQHGLSIYLFILGELVDAWQNRRISHHKRAKMVMRARYFLMSWRAHIISHPEYSPSIQFISRESFDIFLTVCDGLLSLMIIYRQNYAQYPLLPWLHSTEPCEHVFGVIRQIKKDFTFADMLSVEPKLRILLLGAFGDLSPEEQSNETAAGYHHTYFQTDDLDIKELLQYPTDKELSDIAGAAFKEAEQLLTSVGIVAAEMLATFTEPLPSKKTKSVPRNISRGPQTLAQVLALYDKTSLSSKNEDRAETCHQILSG